jgi:hypothetical protein
MIKIALAAAVNDEAVLENNLLASPDVASGALPLTCYRGFKSAGLAYNQALSELGDGFDWVAFVHQDVYLPHGFLALLTQELERLASIAPDAALAGLFGAAADGRVGGKVWCSANSKQFAGDLPMPTEVVALDEYLILVKCNSGLKFDTDLPGFHLFGTDICLAAKSTGQGAWAIEVPVVHNSRRVVTLDKQYRKAWRYMQQKWAAHLPVYNLICPITSNSLMLWKRYLQIRRQNNFRSVRGDMLPDPAAKARELGYE